MRRALLVLALMVAAVACDPSQPAEPVQVADTPSVCGNHLCVSATTWHPADNTFTFGTPHQTTFRGLNLSSAEYRCTFASFGGFMTDTNGNSATSTAYIAGLAAKVKAWGANSVRIPLNEWCWLGLAPGSFSGDPYRKFVGHLVTELANVDINSTIDLHWSSDSVLPTQQDVAPNRTHSLAFWTSVTEFFKTAPVQFDLFNEPRLWPACGEADYNKAANAAWKLYRDGGAYTYNSCDYYDSRRGETIQIAGQQEIIDAIRGAEDPRFRHILWINGLGFSVAFDKWLEYLPTDPFHQLVAAQHQYVASGINMTNPTYYDGTMGPLATLYPVVIGEWGDVTCDGASTGFDVTTINGMNSRGFSGYAWAYDPGQQCNSIEYQHVLRPWGQNAVKWMKGQPVPDALADGTTRIGPPCQDPARPSEPKRCQMT